MLISFCCLFFNVTPGYPETHYVAHANLELTANFLPQSQMLSSQACTTTLSFLNGGTQSWFELSSCQRLNLDCHLQISKFSVLYQHINHWQTLEPEHCASPCQNVHNRKRIFPKWNRPQQNFIRRHIPVSKEFPHRSSFIQEESRLTWSSCTQHTWGKQVRRCRRKSAQ